MDHWQYKSYMRQKEDMISLLYATVEQEVEKAFKEEAELKKYLDFRKKVPEYSVHNMTMIRVQRPEVQMVGSYQYWREQGLYVRNGERGTMVLMPVLQSGRRSSVFKPGYVFDISQTNANPSKIEEILKNKDRRLLKEEDKTLFLNALINSAKNENVHIVFSEILEDSKEAKVYLEDNTIFINPEVDREHQIESAVIFVVTMLSERMREQELHRKNMRIDMAVYMLLSIYGLDTSEIHFKNLEHDFIQKMPVPIKKKMIGESYDIVKKLSESIDSYLEQQRAEVQREKVKHQVKPGKLFMETCLEKTGNVLAREDNMQYNTLKRESKRVIQDIKEIEMQIKKEDIEDESNTRKEWDSNDFGRSSEQYRNKDVGQVWQDEEMFSGREQSSTVQRVNSQRKTESAPVGNRRGSTRHGRTHDGRLPKNQSSTGQNDAADGMGSAYEQLESNGRRSSDDGDYQQLSLSQFLRGTGKPQYTDEIVIRTNHVPQPETSDIVGTLEKENMKMEQVPPCNFHISDDNIGQGGLKQKFANNIAAIETLFKLEQEERNATPAEQEILSRYVGWGGLADTFDPNKENWASEYAVLKNLLSEEEYAAARASTLNAHYTSPTVIRAIYDAVSQMGFENGNILEPSMGTGNFFGMLPSKMQSSRLYGVELDSITGRIAQKLYPNAEITVAGFETTNRRDFYDLAVGNVPFGNYKVSDKPYDKLRFSIHNYFFAKALDQIRPGGVLAFVTSRYTLDSKNSDARRYLAQRAELLGAIRLPNDVFKKNAGTEVVSDIIFLQKRDHPIDIVPDWVHLNHTEEGHTMNSYFVEHPEMVLGDTVLESTPYGKDDITVKPIEGADFSELLKEAVSHIRGTYQAIELLDNEMPGKEAETIPATPDVKNFSYAVVEGEVYFRENSIMRHVELNKKAKERVTGMVELRGIVNKLIEYQLEDFPDEMIFQKQGELNAAYDDFTEKYGLINHRSNAQVFSDDSSYYLLCSLENVDEYGNLKGKADMFTKRTIKPERRVTSVDTPSEALAISIGERGRVDFPFMAELLGTPGKYEAIKTELCGVIFKDPMASDDPEAGWQTADEYLSGDVRSKLKVAQLAAARNSAFRINAEALEKAQPRDLDASEIDVRLGATWVDPAYIQQFMEETFETPYYLRRSIEVKFSEITAEWRINGKSSPSSNDVAAYVTYGMERANAYRILEETLNLKDIRIYDLVEEPNGKEKRVLNKMDTMLAQQKQQAIKDAFRDWVWKDPSRREALVMKYNELFNSTRPREYDGNHIRFGGMNPDITLREHQRNAIAHVLYGGNTLLAHEVGAGKTFEMAASAMESKRLGLSQKAMFVVPNHLTLQWAHEFLYLYPSAKLLVATKKDFETANRKKFCARIATGDYDAIIIGHSQFERIPLSVERQERQLREQIDEIEKAIAALKDQRGENFTIKQIEKTRKSLKARLDKLLAADKKDDVITFEQLGVDRLFVDESHAFKNLFLYTKMRNVAGLSTSEAQKSSDMFMKCRYMDEITGGRGVIFATGTPVSNSMTELYTVMRYLQYDKLRQKQLAHFDSWASTFGETTTAIELAPEGTGYRARTRFAKFFNLPELMNMFKEVADIKTSDQLNLPVPEAKFETVVVQPSEFQKDMVAELSERAAAVHSGMVDPSDDNMLKITTDGRKIGLDQRLMNPLLPDDPNSKLNGCVENILRIWQEGRSEQLTQLVFCDFSTPKNDGTFNVYDDIRTKLLAAGVPSEEVAFIHNADTEAKKKDLFSKVRTGQIRVLLGSTQKMGAGTNVQDKLVAVHHLDVGWRPSDMTQRNGRIIRQGNQNKKVQVYQYVTEGTFDAYLYQTLENKQKFISQIMTSKSPVRSCDDVDEQVLSYAEIKALCAGNPLIKEKMDLDIEVARLKVLKANHRSQQYRMEDKLLKYFPARIEQQKGYIYGFETDLKTIKANPQIPEGFCGIEIRGTQYAEKTDAGELILAACKEMKGLGAVLLGNYRGFQMELSYDILQSESNIILKGSMSHKVTLGTDARGNITRMDNVLAGVAEKLEQAKESLANLYNQQEAAKCEIGKPFPQEAELAEKSQRLAELDAVLNLNEDETDTREQSIEQETQIQDDLGKSHSKKIARSR